ncbi:hypothetical protein AArcMg_2650 [Natrarchaeobaculum sulfurireducens]|uniref:Uncharacterized protein n=1 Tax=Natrarchaeobaculum sulfurireducens TaxID=2044521 RepID=A0A346PSZ5_9EURY|nr:hypothetical protein AArc1_1054 [Natrarchaeobaculum sulfurireducens]AXR82640.1 hypothetical protein AArcMg_2650 [Natrarchaeobaculum sulfurireducens]
MIDDIGNDPTTTRRRPDNDSTATRRGIDYRLTTGAARFVLEKPHNERVDSIDQTSRATARSSGLGSTRRLPRETCLLVCSDPHCR